MKITGSVALRFVPQRHMHNAQAVNKQHDMNALNITLK